MNASEGLASVGVVNVLFAYIEVDISESQMLVANLLRGTYSPYFLHLSFPSKVQ